MQGHHQCGKTCRTETALSPVGKSCKHQRSAESENRQPYALQQGRECQGINRKRAQQLEDQELPEPALAEKLLERRPSLQIGIGIR